MSYKKLEIWQIANDLVLYNTESLRNKQLFTEIHEHLIILGRKLNNFINAVQIKHNIKIVSEPESYYQLPDIENQEL